NQRWFADPVRNRRKMRMARMKHGHRSGPNLSGSCGVRRFCKPNPTRAGKNTVKTLVLGSYCIYAPVGFRQMAIRSATNDFGDPKGKELRFGVVFCSSDPV